MPGRKYSRPDDAVDLDTALKGIALEAPDLEILEAAFQKKVVDLAVALGWPRKFIYHTHDSRKSGKGFPDLVMARPPRLVFIELKKDKNSYVTPEQQDWLAVLKQCNQERYLWRPSDWPEILEVLK